MKDTQKSQLISTELRQIAAQAQQEPARVFKMVLTRGTTLVLTLHHLCCTTQPRTGNTIPQVADL